MGPHGRGRGRRSNVAAAAPRRSAAKRWGRVARVGREVGQEVSRLSRREPGLRDLGRESEMGEDPADHTRILNGRDQAHAAPTAWTREHISY